MKTIVKIFGLLAFTLGILFVLDRMASQGADPSERPMTRMEGRYFGPWVTTKNRKLDGTANCEVKQLGNDRWRGRFWGEWQHVPFDYTVDFAADKSAKLPEAPERTSGSTGQLPAEAAGVCVIGKATIDGAHYDWTGALSPTEFKIQFTGSRYEGHLELARVRRAPPLKSVAHNDEVTTN